MSATLSVAQKRHWQHFQAAAWPESSNEDVVLMTGVARGDPTSKRLLVQRIFGRVRGLSRRLLPIRADAEDAAQMAILQVLNSAHRFRALSRLEAWVDCITIRTALRYRQRQAAYWSACDVQAALARQAVCQPVTDATLGELQGYLLRLPVSKREAFVLKHGFGYSVDEVAELTHAPKGTVKDRLIAARRELKAMIKRDLLCVRPC